MTYESMRVMMVYTDRNPQMITINHDLQTFQRLVDDMIEVVEPF